jgi:HlyD family secretion protein
VEEGAQIRQGDVVVRLSNSQLDLQILDAEANLAEKQNFLRNTLVAMEQDKLNNRNEKLTLELETTRKRRAFLQQEKLYKEDLTAREEYLQAKEDYELVIQKHDLIIERIRQDSILRTVQVEQMEGDLANMRRNVQLIRQRKENLNVRSQIDGELGLLDVVLGQNISAGQKIGQVNDLSDYKIESMFDEHYIDRIRIGLSATFEHQGSSYGLTVRKVFPEVREGKFRTEFVFTGERPDNIRSGQTYYINVELGQPTERIIIPKGTFFQNTGGNWIFVLDADGKKAYRRNIRIGRQNPQFYEVLEGLEAGERVIVSSYESYKDNQVLILND